ncbi:MAG: MCP four helix bundle domain-containing protein, partial [Deltaproteobacteria bacterium]|nr:MCP four helix bundle domain-containing protein [Deltaproteobacteria bacterium]
MGLRAKILSGFLILTMMLLIAGVWSIHELATIGSSVQGILDDNYRSINAARTMTEALEREDSAVLLLLSGKWEEGRSIIRSADAHFQQAFQVASSNVTVPGEQNYIDSLKATYENYREIWKKPIVGTVREGNLKWYFQEAHQAFMEAKLAVERLMAINDRTMYRTASDLKNRTHRATMPGIVAILAALVFS